MELIIKLVIYAISIGLIVAGFVIPPPGVIDSTVLMAVGILFGGYEVIFGNSIKSIDIDRTGIHFQTHDK